MKTIPIHASRSYDVTVGSGLLHSCGRAVAPFCPGGLCAVVTDETVDALYGALVEDSLCRAGIKTVKFVFSPGESGKSSKNYIALLEFLAANGLSRADCIAALGGGVAGDLAGFAAATYLRGIACVQLPTTLLAAVDSSVGGKTGINLSAGKNLAGVFSQPCAVVCDTDTLDTLPQAQLRAGCAEVIKYALLCDRPLFDSLTEQGMDFDREDVIARCVSHKRDYVTADELDNGCRQLLNLGHSVGHAVEALSGYTVCHGQAVAIGMAVITRAAAAAGLCDRSCEAALTQLLERFGLPVQCPYSVPDLCRAISGDKKRRGSSLTLVVPREVGRCERYPIGLDRLPEFLKAGVL